MLRKLCPIETDERMPEISQRMKFSQLLRRALLPALVLMTAGCAVTSQPDLAEDSPEPRSAVQLEPSPSDPFAAIDAVFARMALADSTTQYSALPSSIWPRVVGRFSIASCPEGSSAQRWADWYADNSDYMERVFNRARPWMHFIVEEIERRDLPGELALLPVVESAFDPFAYSHGQASGPWQFLSGTARDFGVEINDWYDGRRDFVVATRAALDYLEYLNGLFDGDWALALAAYNAGQGRVQRAIRRNVSRGRGTAWDELPLPRETLSSVPKLKGLGCLFREPARHAFVLPVIEDRPQVVTLELQRPVDIVALSLASGIDAVELVTLNAGLNRHLTPPGGPRYLAVPVDDAPRVVAALQQMTHSAAIEPKQVRVRRGDTLSQLARRHGTTVQALQRANGLDGTRLAVGQNLVLPGTFAESGPSEDPRYLAAYRELTALQQQLLPTDRFIHRVRSGESLWLIARRYGVGVADLQRMNGLGGGTTIRPGQRLVIETDRAPEPPALIDGTYVVRQGDSLWEISRRQNVDLEALMRWNGLSSGSVLRPGQELVIRRSGDA
jgi:membrane-bound lytic murein transglycosylase D